MSVSFRAVPSAVLPADRTAPSRARRFVSDTLLRWDVSREVVDDSVLLVSELVTNALLHAGSAPIVELTRSGSSFRCSVHDDSAARPRRRRYGNDAVTGRGLALVEALSDRWGSDRDGDGKQVWFEMRIDAQRKERGAATSGR